MNIKIINVNVENVKKYRVANVTYSKDGEEKVKKIMDFANPKVFADVQNLVGQDVEVTITKNGQFFEWSAVAASGGGSIPSSSASSAGTTKVTGSNYETREERATRQVLIVKQSSLSAAVAALTPGSKAALDPNEVIEVAQKFTNFVFDNEGVE